MRSEVKTGVYRVAPAVALRKGEYALYLARGVGMAPYVYDFGVEENSSAVVATASEPKAAQEREGFLQHVSVEDISPDAEICRRATL